MRRSDREITGLENLLAIMDACDVCRLALNGEDGVPYLLPLNFGVEVQAGRVTLYFHGAMEGTKYRLMQRDRRAAFEMDCAHALFTDEAKGTCSMAYRSVIGTGHLEPVPEEETLHALQVLLAHYHREEHPIRPEVVAHTRTFRLVVDSMTGKERRRP